MSIHNSAYMRGYLEKEAAVFDGTLKASAAIAAEAAVAHLKEDPATKQQIKELIQGYGTTVGAAAVQGAIGEAKREFSAGRDALVDIFNKHKTVLGYGAIGAGAIGAGAYLGYRSLRNDESEQAAAQNASRRP
jgi:hypothetical protein